MTTHGGIIEFKDIVFPDQANHYGTLFAGNALQSMCKAAFMAGRNGAQHDVVIARVSSADFLSPIPVGHVLTLQAWVSRVGRSSLTVCVTGLAEKLGEAPQEVLKGVFEMVAVDTAGRPVLIDHMDRSNLDKETT